MSGVALWLQVLAVAAGAAAGALARWGAGLWLNARWAGFPLGTLFVNAVGGLLIGMALAWFERSPNEMLRLLLVTGFLGGLTTFSSFSAESLLLLQRGQWGLATGHTLAHLLGALACAALGFKLVDTLLG
ncbi:MAG TPA: fluoride efflux transporter CrcB [Piscinibacter sp.]|uniref:fluoride efflux transporter CrcB n=1 Tax=Piscinibacter sp. TaxID=1903157 RepID=UPI0025CBEB14|nr:fluoride efflux transporter CrcB [Piscinibacter sp.]HNW64784.1 fluoride efflux transporter CrcB [Piscinibacter sp.]HOY36123.1 fluoride efflux transporter CrcB [Piscinibacter sp.]HPG79865.1 fluoride efflux transporter CrcB [Piscinibacter sp.]HPM67412.1 fluoride efflux transporter CrcB [Piscinibacter sp.]